MAIKKTAPKKTATATSTTPKMYLVVHDECGYNPTMLISATNVTDAIKVFADRNGDPLDELDGAQISVILLSDIPRYNVKSTLAVTAVKK